MELDAYWKIVEKNREPAAVEGTVSYLAEHLGRFLRKGERVLICFPCRDVYSLSWFMEQAVLRCQAVPEVWSDNLWKTLLRQAFTQKVTAIIDHLTAAGYLESVGTAYPTLLLTDKANAVLFDGCRVFMKQIKPKKEARKAKKAPALPLPSTEPSLLASLKALRLVIAEEKGVPAYVVFSNATLEDMCKKRPQTMAGMLDVSGVGHVKLAMYGERFLALLKNSQGEE